MEVSVENTSTLGRRLKVSVPDATVTAQVKLKMAKLGREVRLKGFRPGKVPVDVLNKRFGKSVRMEVIEELIRQTLGEAVEKNDLQPAGIPRIEEINDKQGENLEFVAAFEIFPEITLAELSDITIEQRTVNITDTDVSNMITKLRDQLGNWNPVDRSIQSGDRLTVDFARLVQNDGAEREEQKHVQMMVGDAGVLPKLNEALIGKAKGDKVEVEIQYPQDWPEPTVTGKSATLWVNILAVDEKTVLTEEELADRLGSDKEGLPAKIRESMQTELESVLRDELKEKVLEKVLENNPIEVPNALIDQEKQAIAQDEQMRRQRSQGASQSGMTPEEIDEEAKKRVELGLLLNEVIKKYNLKVDAHKIREEVQKIASQFSKSAEIAEMYYRNTDLLRKIERKILLEDSIDAILKEVKTIDKEASFDEVMNAREE